MITTLPYDFIESNTDGKCPMIGLYIGHNFILFVLLAEIPKEQTQIVQEAKNLIFIHEECPIHM